MRLYIKYMVSIRCKMVVESVLNSLGIQCLKVDLGEVKINGDITENQRNQIRIILKKSGLELMDDKKALLIKKIKEVVIEMIHYEDDFPKLNYSNYIAKKLNLSYSTLSNLFSEATGTTIEHFIIVHKIEKVKELLIYHNKNLSQISFEMNYSSVAHLCSQFKKITGITITVFKELLVKKTNALSIN